MNNMKRLLSILLCLAMVLAVLPMAVSAAGTTIYVQPSSDWLSADAWFAAYFYGNGETWLACTDAGDGLYSVEVPAGYTNVIFCRMNPASTTLDWTNKWSQTGNLIVPTDDNIVYAISGWDGGSWTTLSGEDEGGEEENPVEVTYTYVVAGSEALCGTGWDTTNTANTMTVDGDVASITYTAVAASDTAYEFKVVKVGSDGSTQWIGNGDANVTFIVGTTCDVTISMNLTDNAISVVGDGLGEEEPVVYDYYVAGGAGLCGVEWDPAANLMTKGEDGLYTITLDVYDAGTYEYKITTGSWETPSYGYGEGNYSVVVKNPSEVTITFNAETTEVTCDVVEWGEAEVKWQITNGATAESETVDVRFISYVDSLDYSGVSFYITVGEETAKVDCTKVYTAINANDVSLSANDIFGDGEYLVTFTLTDVRAESFDTDITVYAEFYPLEGTPWRTNGRTIVISDAF